MRNNKKTKANEYTILPYTIFVPTPGSRFAACSFSMLSAGFLMYYFSKQMN